MYPPVVTSDPAAVLVEVQAAYLGMFPRGDKRFAPKIFRWVTDCFNGRYADYLPIDAQYHDFEHTLQGTLCLARLLHGRHQAGVGPRLTAKLFELGLLAILLHDTGYLKRKGDVTGTGAKYTVTHVDRSADFATGLLKMKRFRASEIQVVQNMILCTDSNLPLAHIPFQSELERIVGFALSTADLLGQMAADDYVPKLPVLYSEFAEAARHPHEKTHPIARFSSASDLMEKTPAFWKVHARRRLEHECGGLYRFLNQPYPAGPNDYIDRIEANMNRLKRQLALIHAAAV
ncbi:MAG: hypothetical protein JWR26_583 [Pedosphaera sp.]|nr:hypothetical protein [Pedosphaera sp.]